MRLKAFFVSLAFLFLSVPAAAATTYSFEFFDYQTNRSATTFPFGHQNEIIVASQTQDVRNALPIDLSMKVNGSEVWKATIARDPEKNCRGKDGCSTRGPVLTTSGNPYVELSAKDKNGRTLTTYTQGTAPKTETTTSADGPNRKAQSTASATAYWWIIGLVTSFIWLFTWWFVGRQWWRLNFWIFRWPQPAWFFVPLFWAVPHFLLGLFQVFYLFWPWTGWWWLGFGGGWLGLLGWGYFGWRWIRARQLVFRWPHFLWFFLPLVWFVPWLFWWPHNWLFWFSGWFGAWWWYFPYLFWLPWWVIVFKEKEIWLWNEFK